MSGSAATFEAYDRVEFTTARGVKVIGKALDVPTAIKLLRLLGEVQETGSVTKQADLIDGFVQASQIGETKGLTMGEIANEVITHFLFQSGTPAPSPVPPSSTSGGTT